MFRTAPEAAEPHFGAAPTLPCRSPWPGGLGQHEARGPAASPACGEQGVDGTRGCVNKTEPKKLWEGSE